MNYINGNSAYGTGSIFGGYGQPTAAWCPPQLPTLAPPVPQLDLAQMAASWSATFAAMSQTGQAWGAYASSGAAVGAQAFASSPVVTGTPAPAPEPPKESGKGGLFGTGILGGLFGADSPVLNVIHSVLDPIPVVGDIAKMVCSVVSPAYHEAAEQKTAPPPATASLALAYSASPGYGEAAPTAYAAADGSSALASAYAG